MPTAERILAAQVSLPTLEEAFEEQVDQWVLDAITGGWMTFGDILQFLPGVYPTVALHSIGRLAKRGILPTSIAEGIAASARQVTEPKWYNNASGLPVPHPLNFEWRFAAGAQELIWEHVLKLSQGGDTIALLGTPSLFRRANLRQGGQRHCILVDASRATVALLSYPVSSASANFGSVIYCDIPHGRLPVLTAQVIVVDPPWYPAHIHAFLQAASQMCVVGGHVLLSVPPVGTRPGITEEWAETLELAERMGLRLERSQQVALPYVSPPFERSALRAAGVSSYPSEWRRGNMVVFQRAGQAGRYAPPPPPSPYSDWIEESVEGVRIRMRSQENSLGDPELVNIISGDVLPSVSRRDERRQLADVWTSGNRVFRCANTACLRQVCRAVARGEPVSSYIAGALRRTLTPEQERQAEDVGEQLRQLIRTERGELDRCGW